MRTAAVDVSAVHDGVFGAAAAAWARWDARCGAIGDGNSLGNYSFLAEAARFPAERYAFGEGHDGTPPEQPRPGPRQRVRSRDDA
ncbi:hypothetical protein DFR50_101286 [Roseiarcus fermentans]|uniref:Uncharacterized protein n=1 Tax=Roseiarcus fermentans TaxID=1473586 RepID=A0A366FV06_9HYPH|nr:hypothetical protein DFR50_101286 [Roseiarcus fermentans]